MINLVAFVGKKVLGKELARTGPSLTFARLCTSRHIDDLQSIASLAILAAAAGIACVFATSRDLPALKDEVFFFGGVVATAMAALSWAYQAGSRRLGAVDLFASEISVICRVCLIVDFAKASVASARPASDPQAAPSHAAAYFDKFNSREHYTPAFDNSIADLQALDFEVVTNVTRFYTYRMTMLDLLRKIAEATVEQKAELHRQMIYMQYLMYESARRALVQLIEFEPHQSEAVIIALCSEMELYGFLRPSYGESFQGEHLDLRAAEYDTLVADLAEEIAANETSPHWLNPRTTAPELMARYASMKGRLQEAPALQAAA